MKRKQAIALQYNPEKDETPKIVASGKGVAAENMIRTAEENSVPIHKDAQVAQSLGLFALGEEIPPELYGVVAQILIFVSDMDENMAQWREGPANSPDTSIADDLDISYD